MKFNLKMFINVLPKKSVLKKNKWVLVILALVILIGLYWYSKKSQENYYNSMAEGAWGGNKKIKQSPEGLKRLDTLSEEEQTNLLRFANHISGIRDTFYKVEKENRVGGAKETNGKYCFIERKKGTTSMGEGVTNLNDYGTFIDINQKDTPAASIWTLVNNGGELGPERPATDGDPPTALSGCSDLYSELFTEHQREIKKELLAVQSLLDDGAEPEYIDEIIHEQVTLYLGHTGCQHSNDFLNKIWTDTAYTNANNKEVEGENLRKQIIEKFPGIELDETTLNKIDGSSSDTKDIIRCEHTPGPDVGEDLSATTNLDICKLAGFYADPKDEQLYFPLIQYSFLGKTNKDRDSAGVYTEDYTRYTVNFDPTKKLGTGGEMVDEDVVDGVKKTVYTSQKILDWLSNLRGK